MSTGFINFYEMNTKQMQLYMQKTTCGIQNSWWKTEDKTKHKNNWNPN